MIKVRKTKGSILTARPDVQLVESEELGESERGTGGYGSSGK